MAGKDRRPKGEGGGERGRTRGIDAEQARSDADGDARTGGGARTIASLGCGIAWMAPVRAAACAPVREGGSRRREMHNLGPKPGNEGLVVGIGEKL